jgi:hypothetical protein
MSRRFRRPPAVDEQAAATLDERLRSVWFELAGVLDRLEHAEERLARLDPDGERAGSEAALDGSPEGDAGLVGPRVIASHLLAAGCPPDEVVRYLRTVFDVSDPEAVLDDARA